MRTVLAALALASLAPAALADVTQPLQAAVSTLAAQPGIGHHERMHQRYCEKLREGPEAYAAFVKRMAIVTGYTFTDFAPRDAGDAVRYACRESGASVAARAQSKG